MKIQKKNIYIFFFFGGGGSVRRGVESGGGVGGVRGRCDQRIEVFVKIKKKIGRGGGVGLG